MKTLRYAVVCLLIAVAAACSSAPSKSVASVTPVAPALPNISGNWLLSVGTPAGTIDADMSVVQNGANFSGRLESRMGNVDYTGTLNGNDVRFSYDVSSLGAPAGTIFTYTGVLEDGSMKGKAVFGPMGTGEWSAKRR